MGTSKAAKVAIGSTIKGKLGKRSILGFTEADLVVVPSVKKDNGKKNGQVQNISDDDRKLKLIPIHLIRPYKDQPRKSFDFDELKGLAESMGELGQEQAILVCPIIDGEYQFELIDGERRFRAAKLRGDTNILAIILKVSSESEQFVRSVAANFCRVGHTHIETAKAAQRVCQYYSEKGLDSTKAVEKTAKIFGHSISWIWQYVGLLRLCPEVQEMMEDDEISFQIGVALTNFKEEEQARIARHIVDKDLNRARALHLIRLNRDETNLTPTAHRRRRPSDDYGMVQTFLNRLGQDSEIVFDMPFKRLEDMFWNRPLKDLEEAIKILGQRAQDLSDLRETLQEIRRKLQKTREHKI